VSAKWYGSKFCLATREVRQAVLGAELDREEDFYTTLDGDHEAILCWGPSYECNLYWGNTWPLEVVVWWFRKSSGVCKIVTRMTRFRMIALFSASDRVLVVWEQLRTPIRFGNSTLCCGERLWQTYSHVWTIRWWPVVGRASRHSYSKDRSVYSSKGV